MFRSYDDIFEQRGLQYHRAMRSQPHARQAEFETLLAIADLHPHLTIADIPSGGGYLQTALPIPAQLIQIETCPAFVQANSTSKQTDSSITATTTSPTATTLLCRDLHHIPLPTDHLDRILSLAGLHHIADRATIYVEFHRLLKHHGLCCIGEVAQGSGVAGFLNEFVDRHSSLGHRGLFFEEAERTLLEQAGFQIVSDRTISYPWQFPSQLAMVQFCRDLFGIDRASDAELLEGIQHYLGHSIRGDRHQLQWQLRFIKAQKQTQE